MNTTPKQQDDGGIAAADGSRPTLEQTVLGVAPPPSGVTPTAGTPLVTRPAESPPAEAGLAIVAAPTITVADFRASDVPVQTDGPSAPTLHSVPASDVGDTLAVAWPSPHEVARPEAHEAPESAAAAASHADTSHTIASPAAPSLDHTALSADYLRSAREAALSQLAGGPSPPNDPHAAASSPSAAMAKGSTSTESPPDERALDAAAPNELALDAAPPSVGTRRSIAMPSPTGAVPAGAERSGPASARCFEPVPVIRAPLAESLSGALSPIVDVGGHRHMPPSLRPLPPTPSREAAGRWLLLGSVALATVGVVTLGTRLVNRYRGPAERAQAVAAAEQLAPDTDPPTLAPANAASRALMANRPAPERGTADGRPQVVSATGAPGASAASESTLGASPESQLAATAGRHILTGNYAEALPLYRQLERSWPANTAYAAMARLLEERLGSTNDTRTISPTLPHP